VVETRRAGRSILFLFLSVVVGLSWTAVKKNSQKKQKIKILKKILATHAPFTIIGFFVLYVIRFYAHTRYTLLYFLCLLYGPPKREERRVGGGEGEGGQKRHAAFLLPGYIQFITVYYTFYKKWVVVCRHRGMTKGEQ